MADLVRRGRVSYRVFGIVCLLAVIVIPLGGRPDIATSMTISFYYVVLAVSWNLLAGYAGQFSLAQQTFATIGAYTTGLTIQYLGVSIWIGIILAVLGSAILGAVVGALLLRLRSLYFAIATWAFAGTVQILLTAAYSITRGQQGLSVPPLIPSLNASAYYYVFLGLALLAVVVSYGIVKSPMGLYLRSIKDDDLRVSTMGLSPTFWKISIFVLASALCGLAGALYAHYVVVISPNMADFSVAANVVIMVIIGGLGTISGPVVGGVVIGYLSIYFQEFGAWNTVAFAILCLIIMRLWGRGLVLLGADILRGRKNRSTALRNSADALKITT